VLVIARGDDGGYGLHPREVDADDLAALRGELVEFIGRPTVVISADGSAAIVGGERLDIEFSRDGGHLLATDYDGLIAVSAYHHLTQAGTYFLDVGLDVELGTLRTAYRPLTDYGGSIGPHEFHDNASYVPAINAFLLLEEKWLDYVPLAANEGVMAHEFAHAVFDAVAGGPLPDWDHTSINLWRSINEGLADVHAVALTGDPAFARASAGAFVANRDVSVPTIELTEELLATALEESYNPYPIGTVIAAVFWDFRTSLVDSGVDGADASRAMGQLAHRSVAALEWDASGLSLGEFAAAVTAEANESLRTRLCEALWQRAGPIMDEVPACH
jgi:hypothetical protein